MIAATVAAAMRGDRLRELRTAEREVTMRLMFRASDRQAIEDLASLPITLPDKSTVSLGSIATFRVEPGDRAVERINRLTSVVIAGNLTTGTTFDEIKMIVEPIMTQLTLGLDRDSAIIAKHFDERDDAVKALLKMAIDACRKQGKYIGICGQGPSDHPDFARWLLEQGIESMRWQGGL